ncbi:N-acetylmuramoyl-L-alanine amidase family protein [Campylobacter molothri]|uniref:N-acetylmuramoyl-L-alanine amidase family protein n=1 Tax=Campylobacter molothri TaxID=1032242 RepID=UPI001907ACE2|nr:N-acetylmuramoyl-L-alanine amidase [Campylobacter sp. 2018MI35]MBK2001043.1 N-acetylmuramoyl-L-alanine amidase [Campylobacter sp. 2018MI35]MBZ7969882.1 N-acetylmuramoyl-L-alanine amidase [Campylobacter sp. RM3125]MBZ7971450.1 N-acetylmuramoyl-L-alanine amidase [Campylobacter sp. RM3124]
MIKFLFFFFIFVNICFGAYEKELDNFDNNFITSKTDIQIKFHQQLKSLYIQSVINEDEKTKIEILKRLIISSNVLNLDDRSYAEELKESGVSQSSINALRKAVIKDKKRNNSLDNAEISTFSQTQNQENASKNEKKHDTNIKVEKKPQIQNNLSEVKKENDKIYILNSNKINQSIELRLNANLSEKDVKSFVLDEKGNFRYISDFSGILEGGKKEYKMDDYRVVISQFNPKTIRIVIYAKERIPIVFDFNDKKIKISKQSNIAIKNTKKEIQVTQKDLPKKQEIKPIKVQVSQEKKPRQDKKDPLYVLDVDKISNSVILNLSDNLSDDEISIFSSKDQKFFRQIVSFKGVLEGNRKNFTFGKNNITVTQYNPKTVRVVLSSSKDFNIFKNLEDKTLTLGFQKDVKKTSNSDDKKNKNNNNKNILTHNFKSKKIIVIDAGHGGKDSGALGNKQGTLKEKNVVLSTALKLGNELKKRGYRVLYTRSTDQFINLRDRTKFANDKRADLFISVHANAAPNAKKAKSAEGVETFFLSPARSERSKKAAEKENQGDFEEINYFSKQSILNFLNREKIVASNKLAIDVQKNILTQTRKKYKIVDGGVREAPFWVLVGAQMPAILIEIGYITHPNEGQRIASKTFQDILAKGIADGVDSYFYHNR